MFLVILHSPVHGLLRDETKGHGRASWGFGPGINKSIYSKPHRNIEPVCLKGKSVSGPFSCCLLGLLRGPGCESGCENWKVIWKGEGFLAGIL